MHAAGKHVVIVGGAGGIGRELAQRFAADGARTVVIADHDLDGARRVARRVGGLAVHLDAGSPAEVQDLIATATAADGPIDVYLSAARVDGPDTTWESRWRVHVMSHVWACRELLPQMTARNAGYLINTASARPRHAALALAEWLSLNYRDKGVRASCVCTSLPVEAVIAGLREDRVLVQPRGPAPQHWADHGTWLADVRRILVGA